MARLGRLAGGLLPVVVWMGLIFWLSSQSDLPGSPDPLIEVLISKSAHTGEYAILGLLLWRFFAPSRAANSLLPVLLAWAVAVIYAISDEFHQSFTPLRTPSPIDVLIDASGAALGLLTMRRWGNALRDKIFRSLRGN